MQKYVKFNEQAFNAIDFQTGDILLFSGKRCFIANLIKACTCSKYSHAAMVIKDPEFPNFKAKGIYMIESTTLDPLPDAENHIRKFGVQIHILKDVIRTYDGDVYWRKLHCNRDFDFYQSFNHFHSLVHNDPYDFNSVDWMEMALHMYLIDRQVRFEFVCSALVSYGLVVTGSLASDTPWTLIRPCDLGTESSIKRYPLSFRKGCFLDDEVKIILGI